jgi:hypothetical protein
VPNDVKVNIGATLSIHTTGVEEAKRHAADVAAASQNVKTAASDAGATVTSAMGDAADAILDTAAAMRAAAEASRAAATAQATIVSPSAPRTDTAPATPVWNADGTRIDGRTGTLAGVPDTRPADRSAPPATPETPAATVAAAAQQAATTSAPATALAYDPRTHAHRATSMLHGIEANLAGGVTSQAQIAQLENRARRAGYYVEQAGAGGLPAEQTRALIEHLEAVTEALAENRKAVEENTKTDGGGDGGAPRQPEQQNPLTGQLIDEVRRMAGGGLAGMGTLGRVIGRLGPWGLAAGAIAGGVTAAYGTLIRSNEAAREEVSAMADLGRQYDTSSNALWWNRDPEARVPFGSNDELIRLGFTATDASQFMSRLDLPGGGENGWQTARDDTVSGLEFSRGSGISETNVADLVRALGVGGIERGQADRSLALVREAMREGLKEGVATSDTFRAMEQALTGMFRDGINLSETAVAFQAGLLSTMAGTGNRQWQGAAGAENIGKLTNATLGGGDFAMQLALFHRVGDISADDLGLTGADARVYNDIAAADPVGAMRIAIEKAPGNPDLMRRFAAALDDLFGDDTRLKAQYLRSLGLVGDELLGALAAMSDGGAEGIMAAAAERPAPEEGAHAFDPQIGNRPAITTTVLRAQEADARTGAGIVSLNATGGLEERARKLWTDLRITPARLVDFFTEEGGPLRTDDFGEGGPAGSRDYSVRLGAPAPAGDSNVGLGNRFGVGRADGLGGPAGRPAAIPVPPDESEHEDDGDSEREDDGARSAEPTEVAVRADDDTSRAGRIVMQESGGEPDPLTATNERTGAFGPSQILPSNLVGERGWDREFIENTTGRDEWRDTLTRAGLDPDDPIPDDVAKRGGTALAEWANSLSPEAKGAIEGFLYSLTDERLADYITRASDRGADPFTAEVRAAAAWYGGESWLGEGLRLDPTHDRFTRRHGESGKEPSIQEYLESIFGPLEYHPGNRVTPKSTTGTENPTQRIEVHVFGLDSIRIEGGTSSQNDRARETFGAFLNTFTPTSHRGA